MSTVDTTPMRPRRQPDWRTLPPPSAELEVSVIVPVRDEARRLPATLRALARQRNLDGTVLDPVRYEVIVLANNCSDGSAEVVRCVAARHPGIALHVVEVRFPQSLAHVGHARAALMNEACRRLRRSAGSGRRVGVIASTDGDTRVAPDWIAATLAEVASGADAVGGRIVTADDTPWPPGLERLARRDDAYQRLAQQARARHRPRRGRSVAAPPPALRRQPGDHRRCLPACRRPAARAIPGRRGAGPRAAPARPAHAAQRARLGRHLQPAPGPRRGRPVMAAARMGSTRRRQRRCRGR